MEEDCPSSLARLRDFDKHVSGLHPESALQGTLEFIQTHRQSEMLKLCPFKQILLPYVEFSAVSTSFH